MNHLIEMSMSFIKTGIILSKLGWILSIELVKYLLWYHRIMKSLLLV